MAVPYSSPHQFESIPDPEEANHIQQIADMTIQLLQKRYAGGKPILRGVHAKSHGCVRAEFQVLPDLAPELQIGLFSHPGKRFDAWIRFSNAAVLVEPDLKNGQNGSRGMAIKVLDVGGDFLFDDAGQQNQDFLMINTPAFAFANVQDYLRLTQVLLQNNDNPAAFFAPLKVEVAGVNAEQKRRIARSAAVLTEIQSKSVANPLQVPYFSASPYLFGQDRVMQFSVIPGGELIDQILPQTPSDNYLNEALTAVMAQSQAMTFDFRVQVKGEQDREAMQIEDATAAWDWSGTNSEIKTVARITIPAPQSDINTAAEREACEQRLFTPWHSDQDHQPLGGINRLRKAVYFASANHRRGRVSGGHADAHPSSHQ